MIFSKKFLVFSFLFLFQAVLSAQFIDNFDKDKIDGWFFFTGDGNAEMDFIQRDGYASILIDATKDKYNVYWTLIKRDITPSIDLKKFADQDYQLRVEAKVRIHNAPRRLNMMINTQRTTDYHKDLMEFDIADTTGWHTISMTTKDFDAFPGDTVYVQLCATDYGPGKYIVDVDYYKADIVNINTAGPEKGELVPYHPFIPDVNAFTTHLDASQDCLINSNFPHVNFNNWSVKNKSSETQVLTINADQWAVLKWNFEELKNLPADTSGLLELTTYTFASGGDYSAAFGEDLGMEFGKIRVIEILGGDENWDQNKVTYHNFMNGKNYEDVFNEQMTYDAEVTAAPGGKIYITISKPVMNRLLTGKTKGLLIRPLGAVDFSFYASEDKSGKTAKLHFSIEEKLLQ